MATARIKDHLAYLIATLNKQLEDELQERLRPAGIALEQLRVLEALQSGEGLSMGALAAKALVEPTTLTNIVDRMVSDGLVFRAPDPNDRRRVLIVMAQAGKTLFRKLDRITASQEQRLSRQIQPDQLASLRHLLRDLMQA